MQADVKYLQWSCYQNLIEIKMKFPLNLYHPLNQDGLSFTDNFSIIIQIH